MPIPLIAAAIAAGATVAGSTISSRGAGGVREQGKQAAAAQTALLQQRLELQRRIQAIIDNLARGSQATSAATGSGRAQGRGEGAQGRGVSPEGFSRGSGGSSGVVQTNRPPTFHFPAGASAGGGLEPGFIEQIQPTAELNALMKLAGMTPTDATGAIALAGQAEQNRNNLLTSVGGGLESLISELLKLRTTPPEGSRVEDLPSNRGFA